MADATPEHASETEAREVAEAAREKDWEKRSFTRALFEGRFRLDLLHPYPEPDPEERERARPFLEKLEAYAAEHLDGDAFDREGQVPQRVLDELAEIDQLQDLLGDHLVLLRNKREQLEVGLRRARRLEGTESAAGENLLDIDVEAIMREIELSSREPSRAVTVEEHIERQRKQALLDETMR